MLVELALWHAFLNLRIWRFDYPMARRICFSFLVSWKGHRLSLAAYTTRIHTHTFRGIYWYVRLPFLHLQNDLMVKTIISEPGEVNKYGGNVMLLPLVSGVAFGRKFGGVTA